MPENIEICIERRYFSKIYYLALVCSDEALSERLQMRPGWRGAREAAYIEENSRFNNWFKAYGGRPVIKRIDTTDRSIDVTAQQVVSWIDEILRLHD